MNQLLKIVTIGLVAFLASAALAFWIGGNLGAEDVTAEATMPVLDPPLPVIVPVPFEGDPAIAVEALAEQANASRVIASEIGVTLEPSNPSGIEIQTISGSTSEEPAADDPEGSSTTTPETTTTGASPGTTEDPVGDDPEGSSTTVPATTTTGATPGTTAAPRIEEEPLPPAGGTPPAEETAIDFCVDGGEGCPEGISGTILALHAVPPLAGTAQFLPPGAPFDLVCPARAAEAGKAYFVVTTNRPAIINLKYQTWEWREDRGAIAWTTVSLATTVAGDEVWEASDAVTPLDPGYSIRTCVTLEDLPPRDDYVATFTFAVKEDPSIAGESYGLRLVNFVVPDSDGLVPGAQRRSTTLVGVGIDQLMVGMTREPDQTVAVAARRGTDPAICEIAGDTRSIYSGEGTVRQALGPGFDGYISDNPIDPAVLSDPAYPYLAEHTRSVVTRLDLEEGTNYVVCAYWIADGPAFDSRVIEIAESIPVSTPEAYRPTVILHGLENLFGGADRVEVSVPGCGGEGFDLTPSGGSSPPVERWQISPPLELCTFNDGLTEIDRRGIRVEARATAPDGTSYSGGVYVRTDLDCPATCLVRLPEMALVPLPRVPADDSDCGSGFGTGCLSDGLRSAGDAIIEIQYDFSAGSRTAGWSMGEATDLNDPTPPLAETPQIDVQTTVELNGHPTQGARASVTIVADRPVTLSVEAASSGDPCTLGDPSGYDSTTLSVTHTFTISPLCLGYEYLLAVDATDESGRTATIVGEVLGTPEGFARLYVPTIAIRTKMSATITAPTNDKLHTVYVRRVTTRTDDVRSAAGGFFTQKLYWTWPDSDRTLARSAGWQMFGVDGQANACGSVEARPFTVTGRRAVGGGITRSSVSPTQDGFEITVRVDIYENRPLGGAIVGECVPGDVVENVELAATVSLQELFDGFTLSSESGSVVFSLDATGYRRELGG